MPDAGSGYNGSGADSDLGDVRNWADDDSATTILLDGEIDALMVGSATLPRKSPLALPRDYAASLGALAQQYWWLGLMIALPGLFGLGWIIHTGLVVPLVASRVAVLPASATASSVVHHGPSARAPAAAVGAAETASVDEAQQPGMETGFTVNSTPSGAAVFVDDVRVAQVTPARVTDLVAGTHRVRLSAGDDYREWTTSLAMARGQVIFLPTIELARVEPPKPPAASRRAAAGALTIHSLPWAQVEVDGKPFGHTPRFKIPLRAGPHRVVLSNPQLGLRKSLSVRIAAGKTTIRSVALLPQ